MPRRITDTLRADAAEAAALAADDKVNRRGTAPAPAGTPVVVAPGYLHATHPDTGLRVVFTPGEALPAWAAALLPDPAGVLELD